MRNRSCSCAPVFVVGSSGSGTTLLYDMLLSAGGFGLYLGESNIFNLLAPRFGDLAIRKNRERMWRVWVPEVKSLFRRVPSPPTYPLLQSKKNIALRALRKPLTSKGADEVVLVDEKAPAWVARWRATDSRLRLTWKMAGQP